MKLEPATEASCYKKLWETWLPRTNTVVRQWAMTGVIGLEYDDLQSLARLALLKSLRSFDPSRAKFQTLYFTCLANSIKTNYYRAGLIRQAHRIKIIHRKTGDVCVLSRRFSTHEEALSVASCVRSRRSAHVYLETEIRHKRIPPNLFVADVPTHSQDPEGDHAENQILNTVARYDRRQFDLSKIMAIANRRCHDRRERQYAQLIVMGHSPEIARRTVHYTRSQAELKLRKLRRLAVGVMKELVA